jgi:hypothetical protein
MTKGTLVTETPKSHERRTAPRFPANPDTVCRVMATDDPAFRPAELHNISASGIKIVLPHRYEAGTILTVQLCHLRSELDLSLLVRVVHVAGRNHGKYSTGCAFLAPLQGHELLALAL